MSELNRVIDEAVARQDLPFAVAMTAHADGVAWSGAAGEAAPGKPAALDTVFRIFSMTKAVGSTAAMILMDRGMLKPHPAGLPLMSSLRTCWNVLCRRQAEAARAAHQGHRTPPGHPHLGPDLRSSWNADMPRYMEATGVPTILSGLKVAMNYPLMFEPGERWDYGIGIDWLGRMVEKIDGRRIDQFCNEEIFDPLGMNDTRCEVEPHMAARLAGVSIRGEDGKFAPFDLAPPSDPEFYGMGVMRCTRPHPTTCASCACI